MTKKCRFCGREAVMDFSISYDVAMCDNCRVKQSANEDERL